MKRVAQLGSFVALGGTVLPAVLFFSDSLSLAAAQLWMLLATGLWFVTSPLWMEHKATD